MDGPLWTSRHAPDLSEIRQTEARERLDRALSEPMNLVVQGPPGVGKTAATRALAREAHADPDNDLIEINVADFFGRTKKEIRNDPRFESFLAGRSGMAKRDMINRVLTESAAYAPMSGDYKTIVLDNAEAIREDFQQALRRVMERHHRTTQFVITTRQPTKLIPPIRSRCFPIRLRAPTIDETIDVLATICDREDVAYDDDGLEFVASAAGGDLRRAILSAQATAVEDESITMSTAYETLGEVGHDEAIREALAAAVDGDLSDARSTLGGLLDDEGYDGPGLLREILRVARAGSTYGGDELARLHTLAGEVDLQLAEGLDDQLHLTHLLAAWAAGRETIAVDLRDPDAAAATA
ncbi:AAA family ATPase [Halopenitus persicus]|uniref:Replication factor C small subunit n=1 Tax=Halopenitus persicus TaxID=1048396 RepID=A0A1H3FHQ6_9EURY|nr:AAA family ATPase [Halopenitus persicus]SDX90551.1 replication factor C small subunit [Halopenitus persicus]